MPRGKHTECARLDAGEAQVLHELGENHPAVVCRFSSLFGRFDGNPEKCASYPKSGVGQVAAIAGTLDRIPSE